MKYCLLFILILSACSSQETKVNSHQSKVHYNLALELAQNALYQNSLDEFAKAISLDPGNINAYRKKDWFILDSGNMMKLKNCL